MKKLTLPPPLLKALTLTPKKVCYVFLYCRVDKEDECQSLGHELLSVETIKNFYYPDPIHCHHIQSESFHRYIVI